MFDEKIIEVCKDKGITNFWECFEFMTLAGYGELESIITSLEVSNGDIWNDVINVQSRINPYVYDGRTITRINTVMGVDTATDTATDDRLVTIFMLSNGAKPFKDVYKSMYKAYIETRKYEPIEELEKHIKIIEIKLTTDLGIKMFDNGSTNFK